MIPSAQQAGSLIRAGKLTSEQFVQKCLDRIASREPTVQAWSYLNPEQALLDARIRDNTNITGPLHGIPVAIKDVIDVAGMPTGMGSPIYRDYHPPADAACVSLLRKSGAVIMGKTVTAEFAGIAPGPTTHPLAPHHTPGGSSSGSAAAVADHMVPLALGTQTGGSVLRPAAFCGIIGFKPSFGLLNRAGLKMAAESFDTIGIMARDIDDTRLLWSALTDYTPPTEETYPRTARLKFFRSPFWDQTCPETRRTLHELNNTLQARGWTIEDFPVPDGFSELTNARAIINNYERVRALSWEAETHEALLSPAMQRVLEAGRKITYTTYIAALRTAQYWRTWFSQNLAGWDGLITPSASGEAPQGLDSTGTSTFQEIWTMLHVPAITLPMGFGKSGLPIGIQLVGRHYEDASLLNLAKSIVTTTS